MKQISIKDNSLIKKESLVDIPKITNILSDKTVGQLQKEGIFVFYDINKNNQDISKNQLVISEESDYYKTQNIMGFIGCGDERLIIQSRFNTGTEDFFTQYLIEQVMEIPNLVELKTTINQDEKLMQLLMFLFPSYLKAAVRKGIYREYRTVKYNDEYVKGVIDINRHIRDNTPFIGKIAYNKREISLNNEVMQLVRHTVEYIRRKPYGNRILANIKNEIRIIEEVTPNYSIKQLDKTIKNNQKRCVRHSYYHEYIDLQRLCLLILRNEKYKNGIGNKKTYGILFDGAWLWEEYINLLVKKWFYHPKNKSNEGGQKLFSNNIGLIYPDFISRGENDRIIADAKYKPIVNINSKDYLQILAYMYRFDSRKAFFLYPESENNKDQILKLNEGITYENNVMAREDIFVVKHGLNIPENVVDYNEFVQKIKKSETEFTFDLIKK